MCTLHASSPVTHRREPSPVLRSADPELVGVWARARILQPDSPYFVGPSQRNMPSCASPTPPACWWDTWPGIESERQRDSTRAHFGRCYLRPVHVRQHIPRANVMCIYRPLHHSGASARLWYAFRIHMDIDEYEFNSCIERLPVKIAKMFYENNMQSFLKTLNETLPIKGCVLSIRHAMQRYSH